MGESAEDYEAFLGNGVEVSPHDPIACFQVCVVGETGLSTELRKISKVAGFRIEKTRIFVHSYGRFG